MSVMNEIKQNVLLNAFNLIYSAKVNMNAGDSIFMEGLYSDFLRQMDILIASVTDEDVKKTTQTIYKQKHTESRKTNGGT